MVIPETPADKRSTYDFRDRQWNVINIEKEDIEAEEDAEIVRTSKALGIDPRAFMVRD